jgi:pilus assembly protein CpaF
MPALLDRLQPLFDQPGLTDLVMCGSHSCLLRISGEWVQSENPFESEESLRDWLIDLFEGQGVGLNFKNPMGSVVFGDYRIHAVLAFGVADNVQVSIRRLAAQSAYASMPYQAGSASQLRFQALAVALAKGKSILVAGGAGSGKTTLLRALLNNLVGLRVITIEDVAELRLAGANAVALYARASNQEGSGQISLDRLLREALRMSPDRIAVGEVRGDELGVMLEALNTGHAGAGATIHANSLSDLASRLEALGMRLGIAPPVLARQVVSAFSFAVLTRRSQGFEIAEIGRPRLTDDGLGFEIVA